ncbi:MAG: DUF4113 domain-containing protein [Azoarcus sp.]|jgi:hypothetical protein|nr:DUF4113 domain-containing protein [Azoarcus sp.]
MDAIHRRFGRGAMEFAARGLQTPPKWDMRHEFLPRHSKTSIKDLPCSPFNPTDFRKPVKAEPPNATRCHGGRLMAIGLSGSSSVG